MADRNLRIRMLIEAGDRASRPLRDIAAGSAGASRALADTRAKLKALERTGADIAGFRALKVGLRGTGQELDTARTRASALGRQLSQTERPTRALTREFARARADVTRLEATHAAETRQLGQLRERLRAAGVETTNLSRHERDLRRQVESTTREFADQERRLERIADRERRFANGRERFGRMQGVATGLAAGGAAAIGTGVAMAQPIIGAVQAAQQFESTMTDIGQKADLTRAQTYALGKDLLVASKAANQMPADLQAGVDALAGMGASVPDAVAMMTPIGRAATAYKAEIADLSNAAYAATDNLKVPVAQTQRVIDIMAQAGKAGAFEIKDMAGAFPALTASYQALGQQGTGAVADIAAGLQIMRKGTGDSSSAATNMGNVLQKITSPATARAFAKMGVDLPASLKRLYAEGKTPLEAIAELTNKTLKGDLSRLGYLFEDAQVQQGLRPLIQNMEEYRRIRTEASGASGTTDRDFAERMKDSAEQTKQWNVNSAALAASLGTVLLPTVNAVTEKATKFLQWIGAVAERHPTLTKAIVIGTAAFAALFIVLGGAGIVLAGLVAPFAALSFAAGALNMAMLPTIGIALAVVAGVVALGAAAYLIYSKWGAISGWFGQQWAAIKGFFSGGIAGIAATMLNFSPIGLLYRVFAPALRWLGIDMPQNFSTFGGQIIAGLVRGIIAGANTVVNAVGRIGMLAKNAFKHALGIHSPSRVFTAYGGHIVDGLTNGLAAQESEPVKRMQGLSRRLSAAVVTGVAAPSLALGAVPAGSGGPPGGTPPPVSISIKVYGAPGQSEEAIAAIVAEKVTEAMRSVQPSNSAAAFADKPDWGPY